MSTANPVTEADALALIDNASTTSPDARPALHGLYHVGVARGMSPADACEKVLLTLLAAYRGEPLP
jgi:hypothetical protein